MMTEREKLIEIIGDLPFTDEYMSYNSWEWAEHFADHLLSNGVIVPPVKVGQTVWFISPVSHKPKISETVIEKVVWKSGGVYIKLGCNSMYETSCKSIGKTEFLTREEAEAKLKEREDK